MPKQNIQIGDSVHDIESKASGHVIGIADYKYEESQYLIAFPSSDGSPKDKWLAEPRVQVTLKLGDTVTVPAGYMGSVIDQDGYDVTVGLEGGSKTTFKRDELLKK